MWVCCKGSESREANVLCRTFWAAAIETQRKRACFFKLAQMGCACGLLALAPLPGSVNTAWPLPQDTCGLSCLTARLALAEELQGCSFLVSVVPGGGLGDGHGCRVICFCPLKSIWPFPSGPNLTAKRDLPSLRKIAQHLTCMSFGREDQVWWAAVS